MKEKRLLYAIGWVEDEFIEEMLQPGKKYPRKKLWLLAAIIALLLLLVGCVAVFLRLQDMSIGQEPYVERYDEYGRKIEPTEKSNDVLAFYGPIGTPGYEAAREWYAFREAHPYEPSPDGSEDLTIPENLRVNYHCYNWDMANKVTELAEKYDLKLAETSLISQDNGWEAVLDALGLSGFAKDNAAVRYRSAYLEPPCNFRFYIELNALEHTPQWPAQLSLATYRYHHKDYFPSYGSRPVDLSGYQQWDYVSPEGIKLLLALRDDGGDGYIITEQEDAYITINVSIHLRRFQIAGMTESRAMTAPVLEEIADLFDYSIQPQAVDSASLQAKLNELEAQEREENAARYHTESYSDFADYLVQKKLSGFYAFYDLDGDSREEMLVGHSSGLIHTYLKFRDGTVTAYPPDLGYARLLENGGICYPNDPTAFNRNRSCYYYAPYADGQVIVFEEDGINTTTGPFLDGVKLENGQWFQIDYRVFPPQRTPMEEMDAQAITEKYQEKQLDWHPLEDYPIDADGTLYGEYLNTLDAAITEDIRMDMFRKQAEEMQLQVGCSYYLLRDITGDGKDELFVSLNGEELFQVYTIRNGKLVSLMERDRGFLCRDNILLEVLDHFSEETGMRVFRTYLSFENGIREEVAFVMENVTEGIYSDNMDQRPIPADTAQAIQAQFPREKVNMKLIADWDEK